MQVKHNPKSNVTTVTYTANERSKILTAMALLAVNQDTELRQALEVIRKRVPLAAVDAVDSKDF